ncbi:YopX family protein [Staphylococcus hominis]|uniref:YopX family protein n=1 Tax=Staphylococcus hominis TaxID=1290 RepID=UPI0037A46C7E
MKNFKFRAWDKDHKYMEYTDKNLIVSFGDDGNVDATDLSNIYSTCNGMQNFELMQSTGLKDKNGTEIYEGDIIDKGYLSKVHDEIGVVKFDKGVDSDGFHAEVWLGWITDKNSSLLDVHKKCKVLGNIYENPELLEDN